MSIRLDLSKILSPQAFRARGYDYGVLPVSYVVFEENGVVYAKNGRTGQIEFSGDDVASVIQQVINATDRGIVWVSGIPKPGNVTYKPGVAVVYDTPYFDVVEPPELVELWSIQTGSGGNVNARNVLAEDDILYVAGVYVPFQIYDISDISSPRLVKSISSIKPENWNTIAPNMINIVKVGNYIIGSFYVGLLILDVSRLDNIRAKVFALGNTSDYYIHGFAIKGRYLFGAMHRLGRLAVIDISDPWNPKLVNMDLQIPGAHDVVLDDNVAYVTSYTTNNLYAVDVSNPYSPRIISTLDIGHLASYITRVGKYLFVGDHIGVGSGRLSVIRAFDPTNLTKVAELTSPREKFGYWMQVYGNYLIAISNGVYVHVIDISDPENPTIVYSKLLDKIYYAMHCFIYRDILFVHGHASDLSASYLYAFKLSQLFKHSYLDTLKRYEDLVRQYENLYFRLDNIRSRNSGVAVIPAGSTRTTVNHGLLKAPTKVLVTPYGNARVWVENITNTSFDIVTDTAPSTNLTVAWYAEV